MTKPDPIPGTKHVKHMPSGISTDWYCEKHKQHIVPLMVARGGEPVPACEYCMWDDLDIKSKLDLVPVVRRASAMCYLKNCDRQADAECAQCREYFCVNHMDDSGYLCIPCASGLNDGLNEQGEDESPVITDQAVEVELLPPDESKWFHVTCGDWAIRIREDQPMNLRYFCESCQMVANPSNVRPPAVSKDIESDDFESMYDA